MAAGMQQAQARMEVKTQEFAEKLAYIRKEMGRGADQAVTTWSRRLVKKWAFLAPEKTGRLKAGFWPAAAALGLTTVYSTNQFPNQNEGGGILRLGGSKPSMSISNRVPYVGNAGGRGTGWWHLGVNEVMSQMEADLKKVVSGAWQRGQYKG